ncbi:MAG: hypothetical protein WBG67_09615 [Thermoanaerobaculia bacterium]
MVGSSILSGFVGLPEKEFIEDPIYEHILRGEEDLVAEYCKLDCLDTLLLFLLWGLHCGQLEENRVRGYVTAIRKALAAESHQGWAEIADAMEDWPQRTAGSEAFIQKPSTKRSKRDD